MKKTRKTKFSLQRDITKEEWNLMKKFNQSHSEEEHLFSVKHTLGILATKKNMVRRKHDDNDKCPCCDLVEDTEHILKCKSTTQQDTYSKERESLDILLQQVTTWEVREAILELIQSFRDSKEPTIAGKWSIRTSEMTREQYVLGQRAFFSGLVWIDKWVKAQDEFQAEKKRRTQGMMTVIVKITRRVQKIIREMWHNRNDELHRNEESRINRDRHQQLDHQIDTLYSRKAAIHSRLLAIADARYFRQDKQTLKKRRMAQKERWVRDAEDILSSHEVTAFQTPHRLSLSPSLPSSPSSSPSRGGLRAQRNRNLVTIDMDTNRHSHTDEALALSRRQAVRRSVLSILAPALSSLSSNPCLAAMTDETDAFAVQGSAYQYSNSYIPPSVSNNGSGSGNANENNSYNSNAPTDKVTVVIPLSKLQSASLGIELSDVEFRTNRRVFVKSVLPSSLAAQYNIQKNDVLVSINGQSAERTNAKGAAMMIAQVKQSNAQDLKLVFRNDSFQSSLKQLGIGNSESATENNVNANTNTVTTQVAPAGDTTQRNPDGTVQNGYSKTNQENQQLSVTQLVPPRICKRGADIDDLLKISYIGRIQETNEIFDGSAVMINGNGIPGRGNNVSLFFVLGKQPFGQFPPAFDVGLTGICVGERRRVVVPPVLAYGRIVVTAIAPTIFNPRWIFNCAVRILRVEVGTVTSVETALWRIVVTAMAPTISNPPCIFNCAVRIF